MVGEDWPAVAWVAVERDYAGNLLTLHVAEYLYAAPGKGSATCRTPMANTVQEILSCLFLQLGATYVGS